jgi:hypothetical protein
MVALQAAAHAVAIPQQSTVAALLRVNRHAAASR